MPARSKITQLPDDVKRELDRRLLGGGFSGYRALSAWLREQGFEISCSAAHRYGSAFEARLAAVKVASEQARAVSEAVGDDAGAMSDALISLVEEKAFNVLVNLQTEDPEAFAKVFPKLGHMVAQLSRASVGQKRWMAEVRAKAARAIENIEKKAPGMDKTELLRLVKEEVYGIA